MFAVSHIVRFIAVLVATAACIDTPPLAEPVMESSRVAVIDMNELPVPKLDLLIVIDDTTAMTPYRERVATIPRVITDALESFERGWTDLRVAVTSNDGRFRSLPDSEASVLVDARELDFTHHRNYAGTLEAALARMMDVGSANPGPSQPLDAAVRSLENHSSFLRDDAMLVILMISASDDASTAPVADYMEWMRRATSDSWSRRFIATGIHPTDATRLHDYYAAVLGGARITPIEGDNYAPALATLSSRRWGGSPCLYAVPLDVDAETPGMQLDCALSVELDGATRPIPECAPVSPFGDRIDQQPSSLDPTSACWAVRTNPFSCGFRDDPGYQLTLSGYTDVTHPRYHFECRTN
jgi:hypothetical protein